MNSKIKPNRAPMKNKKTSLIKQTAKLIQGEQNRVNYKGLEITFRLNWFSDQDADIEVESIKLPKKAKTPLEEILFSFVNNANNIWEIYDFLHDEIVEYLISTSEYKNFKKKIKHVCDLSDDLEKAGILNFDPDILLPAEKMAAFNESCMHN